MLPPHTVIASVFFFFVCFFWPNQKSRVAFFPPELSLDGPVATGSGLTAALPSDWMIGLDGSKQDHDAR